MAKTSGEIEKEFIESLKTTTGKDLAGWLSDISNSCLNKRIDILTWLKDQKGFGHMNASLLTGIYLNDGKPVYGSEDTLLADQLAGCEFMEPVFFLLSDHIREWNPDIKMIPKKTYISFTLKREVAAVNIKKKEIRIAFDLGDLPFTETIQKAKMTGPMPRMSHMLVIGSANDMSPLITNCLNSSYERSHL